MRTLVLPGAEFDSIGEFLDMLYGADVLPALGVLAGQTTTVIANEARAGRERDLSVHVLT